MKDSFTYNEDVVRLCTRLCNSNDHAHKTFLLTGVSERDPVDAFAYEAARTFVQLGLGPVLLVDANFDRQAKKKGDRVGLGLLDVLREATTLAEAVFPDEVSDLFYLDSGSTECDYHALLLSEQCGELFKELRQDYAIVIIESASIVNHSECLRLASLVDGVAVVMQPGVHQQRELSELKQAVQGFALPFLGVVFCSRSRK